MPNVGVHWYIVTRAGVSVLVVLWLRKNRIFSDIAKMISLGDTCYFRVPWLCSIFSRCFRPIGSVASNLLPVVASARILLLASAK